MLVYIMTDLEGISGIVDFEYMDRATHFYQSARELLMGDVNAAIAGCYDGGATEVVVHDGHFTGNNFITSLLDPRCTLLDKNSPPWTASLDSSFDATLFVGTHGMAGTLNGFLDHTMSSTQWFEYSINGQPLGEIGMWATMASHFKVPLVYTCGDEAACAEARALLPGIVATPVKRGVGRNHAVGLHPDKAHELIRRDVAAALSVGPKKFPKCIQWRKPLTVRLTFYRSDYADACAAGNSSLKRINARTVEKKTSSLLDIVL